MRIKVHTDASFDIKTGFGAYAFWIEGDGFLYKHSGAFKEKCTSSSDAEIRAICVAVWVLIQTDHKFKYIAFHRDNIYAHHLSLKTANEYMKKQRFYLSQLLASLFEKNGVGRQSKATYKYVHVRGHTDKRDKMSTINRWCDEQCSIHLKHFKTWKI